MSTSVTVGVREVADTLGQQKAAIYAAVRRGEIPDVGVGRSVRIPRWWLDQRVAGITDPKPPARTETVGAGTFT